MEIATFHRGRPAGDVFPLVVAISIALYGGFYPFDPDQEFHPELGPDQKAHPGSILFGVASPAEAMSRKELFLRELDDWAKANRIVLSGTPSHSLYGDDLPSRQMPELIPSLYFQERRGWNHGENQILYADGDLGDEDLEALQAGILEISGQRNSWSNVVVEADGFIAALHDYVRRLYAGPRRPSEQQLIDALVSHAGGEKLTVADATRVLQSAFKDPDFRAISRGQVKKALNGAQLGLPRGRRAKSQKGT